MQDLSRTWTHLDDAIRKAGMEYNNGRDGMHVTFIADEDSSVPGSFFLRGRSVDGKPRPKVEFWLSPDAELMAVFDAKGFTRADFRNAHAAARASCRDSETGGLQRAFGPAAPRTS